MCVCEVERESTDVHRHVCGRLLQTARTSRLNDACHSSRVLSAPLFSLLSHSRPPDTHLVPDQLHRPPDDSAGHSRPVRTWCADDEEEEGRENIHEKRCTCTQREERLHESLHMDIRFAAGVVPQGNESAGNLVRSHCPNVHHLFGDDASRVSLYCPIVASIADEQHVLLAR